MTTTDPAPVPRAAPGHGALWLLLALCAALGVAGWRGWQAWSAHDAATRRSFAEQLDALDARLDALREQQRAQSQRLQQDESTDRVLREEVIGLGQRSALLEQTVEKLADPDRRGAQALFLDEAALLLAIGQQRLQLAGDIDAARRAYALAATLLERADDPRLLDLRQALVQERAALDALGADPRVAALRALDAFSASLPADAGAGRWRSAGVEVEIAGAPVAKRGDRHGLSL